MKWVTRLYVSAVLGSCVALGIDEYQMYKLKNAMLKRWEEREKNEPTNI